MTPALSAVERALRTAAPYALLDALRENLTRLYGVTTTELLLADYSLTVLQRVTELPLTTEPISVHTSAAGRAFGSQLPHTEAARDTGRVILHLPVTVRGDRLGVLSLGLRATDLTPGLRDEFCEIAEILGHQIVVADRDTDLYLQARRKDRLTLAAEMQWQLLPARACAREEYAVGAQLEPAYAIHGDNFDWSATEDRLTLTITNGMGEGIDASMLTNLAVNALRNARRAGVTIADQAALADQAVYARHRGEAYLSVLLLEFHLDTGLVEVVDAGSPQLHRLRNGTVSHVPFEAQLPLGLADDTPYEAQRIRVQRGDRLIFVSDGVHAVASKVGEIYGRAALARAIQSTRLLPAAEVPRAILTELATYRDDDPQDDALIVCLDWNGRHPSSEDARPS
ncbi:serine/threonine-protein phosphatase [Kitasatospora sp. NBC_01560]|uniref:PP2C family protein-serine/threonine phosphatase n=1 Tax=Kitasatospora sp. NBC_01560 TaxID=2975965 RepID=UPI00386D8457